MDKLLRIQISLVSLVIFAITSIILMRFNMVYLQNCLLVSVLAFNTLLSFLYVVTNDLPRKDLYLEISSSFVMIVSMIYVYTYYIK